MVDDRDSIDESGTAPQIPLWPGHRGEGTTDTNEAVAVAPVRERKWEMSVTERSSIDRPAVATAEGER